MSHSDRHLLFTLVLPYIGPDGINQFAFVKVGESSSWRCLLQLLVWGNKLQTAASCYGSNKMIHSAMQQSCTKLTHVLQQGGRHLLEVAATPFLTTEPEGFPCTPFRYDPFMSRESFGIGNIDYTHFQNELRQIQQILHIHQRPARAIMILWTLQNMGLLQHADSDELFTKETVLGVKTVFLISLRSRCDPILAHLTANSEAGLTQQLLDAIRLPDNSPHNSHAHLRVLIQHCARQQLTRSTYGRLQ